MPPGIDGLHEIQKKMITFLSLMYRIEEKIPPKIISERRGILFIENMILPMENLFLLMKKTVRFLMAGPMSASDFFSYDICTKVLL